MKLQQFLLNNYLGIPLEDFSHKAVVANGILLTIKHNPMSQIGEEQRKSIDASLAKIQEIIRDTNDHVRVSLFILDRNIVPQDLSKNITQIVTKFTRHTKVKSEDTITLSQDMIQKYLCEALMRIDEELMMQIAKFSEQIFFDNGSL